MSQLLVTKFTDNSRDTFKKEAIDNGEKLKDVARRASVSPSNLSHILTARIYVPDRLMEIIKEEYPKTYIALTED